ncbi:glucose-6-phosphate isomerase family protein [Escherichia coli]
MKQLHHSGLPLYLDDDGVMVLKPPLNYLGFDRKSAGQMAVVLPEFTEAQRDEPAYDVYRGLSFAEDQERLAADQYQYDITIIMSGTIGRERKKTSGHYHGYNDTRRNTHPELYEVIKGTAAYILQKSPDFAVAPKDLLVDDLIVAVVKEGESIIVPPNYGYCSINIGDGPLVFSNLAYKPCAVHYDTVQFYHGMACYIVEENGQLCVRKNHYYPHIPRIKFATVKGNPHLGITFDTPLYQRYRAAPERFHFLGHVDNYVREIMGMLQYEDDLFPLCQEDA